MTLPFGKRQAPVWRGKEGSEDVNFPPFPPATKIPNCGDQVDACTITLVKTRGGKFFPSVDQVKYPFPLNVPNITKSPNCGDHVTEVKLVPIEKDIVQSFPSVEVTNFSSPHATKIPNCGDQDNDCTAATSIVFKGAQIFPSVDQVKYPVDPPIIDPHAAKSPNCGDQAIDVQLQDPKTLNAGQVFPSVDHVKFPLPPHAAKSPNCGDQAIE